MHNHPLLAAAALLPAVLAIPAPTPVVALVAVHAPLVTPSPGRWTAAEIELHRRDIISDVVSVATGFASDVKSLGQGAVSAISSFVGEEANFLGGFPTKDKVESSLGIDDDQIKALPTQVLNIPPYANYTKYGWNIRFRANVFKQPNIPQDKLDELANKFLIGTSVKDLSDSEKAQARNVTAGIFVVQQEDQSVTFSLAPAPTAGASGEQGGGGAVTPKGGSQVVKFPRATTDQGDLDDFVQIKNDGLAPGNGTQNIQRLNVYTQGSLMGNATAYLVPTKGLTIISDIDDILRITKIYQPKEGILNTFAKPFTPWMNMPDIYANWSRSVPNLHFHYLTTTPEQITRNYMDFIYKHYPGGSFDTRPLNFSDISATLQIRKFLLDKIFQTFPERKFILMGDITNSDAVKAYAELSTDFPGQVQCIFLRNTTATDSSNHFPVNTKPYKDLNQQSYMFFVTPDDLKGVDIQNGHCLNPNVKQNLTFGYQNLPFGDDSGAGKLSIGAWAWALFVGAVFFGLL